MKHRSSIALIVGLIVIVLLIPVWYVAIAPMIVASQLEQIDLEISYVGTFGKKGYIGTYSVINRSAVWEIPIDIVAHVYARDVRGDEVTLGMDVNMIRNDDGETLPPPFSRNSTYVFNKLTLENVKDSPEADKPREGHDPLYPSHLKAGENIPDVWLDNLNITATLVYEGSVEEDGVQLYKYSVNETIREVLWIEDLEKHRNSTLTSMKTILLEPLSGLHAYTQNETFSWIITHGTTIPLVYLTYKSSQEAKAEGIAVVKEARDGLRLLELYIPAILGVTEIALVAVFVFNMRRLKRKEPLD